MNRQRSLAAGLLAVVALAWGAIPLIVREDVPAFQLVAMRLWLGAFALVMWRIARRRPVVPATDRARVATAGVLMAVHWLAFFAALKATTVAVTLGILYLGPVVAAVLAPRVLGERVGLRARIGLALALGGAVLVIRPGGGATMAGVVWALAAALTLAALMLVAKPAAERLGGLALATGQLAVAALVMTPGAVVAVQESLEFWPQFLVLGVVLTGVAAVVYWTAMSYLPVATVGVIMYLEPASAVVWAALFLSESPPLMAWAGVALVIAGGLVSVSEVAMEEATGAAAAL